MNLIRGIDKTWVRDRNWGVGDYEKPGTGKHNHGKNRKTDITLITRSIGKGRTGREELHHVHYSHRHKRFTLITGGVGRNSQRDLTYDAWDLHQTRSPAH